MTNGESDVSKPLAIIHSDFGRVVLLHLDHSMVRHAHRECHIIMKVGGPDVMFGVRQQEHNLTDGTMVLVNAWEPHFYTHVPQQAPITLLTFYFNPSWLAQFDSRLTFSGHPKFFTRPTHLLSVAAERLRDDVLTALMNYSVPSNASINDLMANIFLEISTDLGFPQQLYPAGLNGELGFDARIRQIINNVLEEKDLSVSCNDLFAQIGLSRAQFFRLFDQSTGMTPTTFLNMLRMEACLREIGQLDMSIQTIAERLGYYPQGNFTRFFSKQQGLSPSNYRKMVMSV